MQIQKMKLTELTPAPYNPRVDLKPGDPAYEKLKKGINEFGLVDPIIFNKQTGYVVGGHQRLKVLKDLKYVEVDCVIVDLPPEKEKALNMALNKIEGGWDNEKLAELLNEIDFTQIESDLTGFDMSEIEALINATPAGEISEDDFDAEAAAEAIKEPKTKLGDIYRLGRHRLMCGDSTDTETVAKLMNGQKADMVFTDPPYGMKLNADYSSAKGNWPFINEKRVKGGKKYNNIIGDHEDFKPELITSVLKNFNYCPEIFLWGADYYAELLNEKNNGSWVVWDKRLDESADKMYGSCFELCWSKNKHKRMIARIKWAAIFGTEQEFDKKRHHPTQKPINLIKWFFDYYSLQNKKQIVDLYGGSGSTLIACEQTDRNCFMMELDPIYCDVIIERWEKLTGQKAEKLN